MGFSTEMDLSVGVSPSVKNICVTRTSRALDIDVARRTILLGKRFQTDHHPRLVTPAEGWAEGEETHVRLCAITDEISDDVTHALRVAESLDIRAVEIRVVSGRNIVHHPPQMWHRVAQSLLAGGFDCPVLDSPFLKETPWPDDDDWQAVDWTPFDLAIEAAVAFGARTIRVFSGRRRQRPGNTQWLADMLTEAAGRADRAGLRIAVEIEHVCAIATAAEAVAFAGHSWDYVLDPGNESYLTGRPAAATLVPVLAGQIRHVHIKDVGPDGAWIRVGTGIVGWPDHLAALRDSGYAGHLSMETHYATPPAGLESATRESVTALRELAGTAGIELQ